MDHEGIKSLQSKDCLKTNISVAASLLLPVLLQLILHSCLYLRFDGCQLNVKYAGHRVVVLLCLCINSMLAHGHVQLVLIKVILLPIVKNETI